MRKLFSMAASGVALSFGVITVATAATPSVATAKAKPKVESKKEIAAAKALARAANLKLSDFPAGWTSSPPTSSNSAGKAIDDQLGSCLHVNSAFFNKNSPTSVSSPQFSDSNNDTASSQINYQMTSAQARAVFRVVRESRFPSCITSAMTDYLKSGPSKSLPQGASIGNLTVATMSFPPYGTQSVAYRLTIPISDQGLTITSYADLVFVQQGRALALLSFTAIGSTFDPSMEEQLTGVVTGRLGQNSSNSGQQGGSTATTGPASGNGTYSMGTQVTVPVTIEGIASATVYGYYPNITSTQPDTDTPPSGDTYGAIDAQECAGAGASSTGADETDFTVLLSNGSTANQDTIVGVPTVSPLSSESELGSSNSTLAAGQCDRGWIVFDIPSGVTPTFIQFSGTTEAFSQGNSVVKWTIPAS